MRGFRTRSKTNVVQVPQEMFLCLLMPTSAIVVNNLTIGLFLWAKQKTLSPFFTLISNYGLPNMDIFERIVQTRTRSHCISPGRTERNAFCTFVVRHLENDTHAPLALRLHALRFHLGTEFVFSLHDTRMKCHIRTKISFRMKTGMNTFRDDLYGTEISFRYHVDRYR